MGHRKGVCHMVSGSKDDAWICVHIPQGEDRDVSKEAESLAKSFDTAWSYDSCVTKETREDRIVIRGKRSSEKASLYLGRRIYSSWYEAFQVLERLDRREQSLTSILTAVLCADLALQQGKDQVARAPATVAIIADQGTEPGDTEWEEGEIDVFLSGYIQEIAKGGCLRRVSARSADAAGFWILMAEKLWDPEVRKRIAREPIEKTTIMLLSRLAGAWLEIKGEMAIRVSGTTFIQIGDGCSMAWRQLMEWEGGGIRKGELRYLSGYKKHIPHMDEKILTGDFVEVWSTERRALGLISRQLLDEARIFGVCEPTGSFRMEIHRGMTLREMGVHSMRVCILPFEGMWIALEREDAPIVSFQWKVRKPHLQRWALDNKLMPLLHLTCAALWRDLRVGGKEVMIEEGERDVKPEEPSDGRGRVKFKGRIKWGSESDLETIMREATTVRWHVRKLPYGKKASRRARALAVKLGIDLERGATIVRSHKRGEPDRHAQNVPMRAQGLARLILAERYFRQEVN